MINVIGYEKVLKRSDCTPDEKKITTIIPQNAVLEAAFFYDNYHL